MIRLNLFLIFLCFIVQSAACYSLDTPLSSAYGEVLGVQPQPAIQLQFPYNINTDYVTTTVVGTGSVTQSNNLAVIQTGTGATGSAIMQSRGRLNYQSGQGCSCLFAALFSTGVTNNTQIIGVGNSQDGFFFGYNGTSFGILRRSGGVNTWIAQTAWNGDKFDGTGPSGLTLIPTNGNVFKIQYQWLGFGIINFFIGDPVNGTFVLVHSIQYSNSNITPSLSNPSLQLMVQTINTGNTSNITIRVSSIVGLIEGKSNIYNDTRNAAFNSKTLTTVAITRQENVLSVRNETTFQSVSNQVTMYMDYLSVLNTSNLNDPVVVSLYLNATAAGATFTALNAATSVAGIDITGTTITGGTLLAAFYCSGSVLSSSQQLIDLFDMKIALVPGDVLVVAVTYPAPALTKTVYVGLSWREKF